LPNAFQTLPHSFPTCSPTFVDIQFLTDRDRSLFFHYIAPELLINGIDSEKARVYSFGAISYPLFSSQYPFPERQTFAELLAFVLFRPPLSTEKHLLLPLIVRCLSPDPNDRPPFSEILAAFQADFSGANFILRFHNRTS
jgi:serine/threonine protein kinase